jgi:hypothetical protein
MKTYWIVPVVALLGLGPGRQVTRAQELATQPQPSVAQAEPPYVVAELTQSLNGKKLKPGDRVKAEVSQDVLFHGRIIIPAESKLLGYVTEVKARGGDQQSRLGIVFNKVVVKHGGELRVQGVIHTLAAPAPRRSLVDEPDPMLPAADVAARVTNSGPMGSRPGSIHANSGRINSPAMGTGTLSNFPPLPDPLNAAPLEARRKISGLDDRPGHLSAGMPQGVFGLKGLSLSGSSSAPGPVILSTAEEVKLDYGTQMLVKVVLPAP